MAVRQLIDMHMHMQDGAFDADRPAVVQRAVAAGVIGVICNGTSEADWSTVAELAEQYKPGNSTGLVVYPCFGLHPWYVADRSDDWLEQLSDFLMKTPAGVGEIGLDQQIKPHDEAIQQDVFVSQLQLAAQLGRPVIIHCLRAWGWLLDVLGQQHELPPAILIHGYGGSAEFITPLAAMGCWFSFAGSVLNPKRTRARAALQAVPTDRLLLETDAPDMPPPSKFGPFNTRRPSQRPRNEPANLPTILQHVAAIRETSPDELADQLASNTKQFFRDWPAKT